MNPLPNDNDPWIDRLSAWKPRPPSAGRSAALFGRPADTAHSNSPALPRPLPWVAWMTPAAACALLVSLGLPSLSQVGGYPLAGLASANPAQSAVLRFAAEQSTQNSLPIASFTWTNRIPAPSTTRSGTSVQ